MDGDAEFEYVEIAPSPTKRARGAYNAFIGQMILDEFLCQDEKKQRWGVIDSVESELALGPKNVEVESIPAMKRKDRSSLLVSSLALL